MPIVKVSSKAKKTSIPAEHKPKISISRANPLSFSGPISSLGVEENLKFPREPTRERENQIFQSEMLGRSKSPQRFTEVKSLTSVTGKGTFLPRSRGEKVLFPPPMIDSPVKTTLKNISRKPKNSPLLSIQKFIHNHLIYQSSDYPLTTQKLWNKYQLDQANSLIIREHELNYQKFKKIAEPILETIKLHQVKVVPLSQRPYSTDQLKNSLCAKVV